MEEKDRLQLIILEAVQFGAVAETEKKFVDKLKQKYGSEVEDVVKELRDNGFLKRGKMFALVLTKKGMQRLIQLREAVK